MVSTQQRRNRYIAYSTALFLISCVLLLPLKARADLILYDPEVDVSMSLYRPLFTKGDVAPEIGTGLYFGGYFSRKSRFFTDYFNAERIYTIFETGIAINPIEDEDVSFITIPLHVNFAYRIGLGEKFSLLPFLGTGLQITYNDYLSDPAYNEIFKDRPYAGVLVSTGFELRWRIMKRSTLRLKFDYGIVFDGRLESGYVQYLQLRLPVPFIP